ncbi:MAG TPA: hypothetical protein VND92_09090, partial [Vicinamibacterales bacterium]|nr:hypothetical protein [Vicinamibacterales bacterium]
YTLLSVSLFVPILAGLYWRRAGLPETLASIAAGVGCLMAVQLGTGGHGIGPLTPAMLGLLASALGFLLVMAGRTPRRGSGNRLAVNQ